VRGSEDYWRVFGQKHSYKLNSTGHNWKVIGRTVNFLEEFENVEGFCLVCWGEYV